MVNRMQFYIDGAWVDPAVKKSTPVVNPATEEAMYEIALGSKADVDKAVAAAKRGFTAPFVGLFGTVWGILNALVGIGIAGQASIDKVAGPVGEALIMTAIGLFVAVPAVMGYNWLLGRQKALQDSLRNFAGDLHAYLVSGARMETGGARPAAAKAQQIGK